MTPMLTWWKSINFVNMTRCCSERHFISIIRRNRESAEKKIADGELVGLEPRPGKMALSLEGLVAVDTIVSCFCLSFRVTSQETLANKSRTFSYCEPVNFNCTDEIDSNRKFRMITMTTWFLKNIA